MAADRSPDEPHLAAARERGVFGAEHRRQQPEHRSLRLRLNPLTAGYRLL